MFNEKCFKIYLKCMGKNECRTAKYLPGKYAVQRIKKSRRVFRYYP